MFVIAEDFNYQPYYLPDTALTNNSFQKFVDIEERKLLDNVLGKVLTNDFYTALNTPTPPPLDAKWVSLRDGDNYIIDQVTYRYGGIKEFMIPFITSQWMLYNYDDNTLVGVAVANTENAEIISPANRIVKFYNEASRLVGDFGIVKDNLYGFLWANQEIYTTALFEPMGTKNPWNV